MAKRRRGAERERLLRIISLCLAVERRTSDPFEVEVTKILDMLRKYLPQWRVLEDFILDAETLNRITSIIHLQGDWLKHRSTALFVDPLLIELKIKMMDEERLIDIFSKSWHPIAEMEGLSKKRVEEAIDYWNQLPSLEERRIKLPLPANSFGSTTIEELMKLKLLSEKSFNEILQNFWNELKEKTGNKEKIAYWSFILANTYEDTIYRAYLTSFLVTYGYADMEVNPLEDEAFLTPYDEPKITSLSTQSVSIPIAIDYGLWKSKRKERSH